MFVGCSKSLLVTAGDWLNYRQALLAAMKIKGYPGCVCVVIDGVKDDIICDANASNYFVLLGLLHYLIYPSSLSNGFWDNY